MLDVQAPAGDGLEEYRRWHIKERPGERSVSAIEKRSRRTTKAYRYSYPLKLELIEIKRSIERRVKLPITLLAIIPIKLLNEE